MAKAISANIAMFATCLGPVHAQTDGQATGQQRTADAGLLERCREPAISEWLTCIRSLQAARNDRWYAGDFAAAETYSTATLKVARVAYLMYPNQLADIMLDHAKILVSLERMTAAETEVRDALTLLNGSSQTTSETRCKTLLALASILHAEQKMADAEDIIREALTAAQASGAAKDALLANTYSLLGTNLTQRGKYADAQPFHKTAIEMSERLPGMPPLTLADRYDQAGDNMTGMNRLAEALSLYEKALASRRKEPSLPPAILGKSLYDVARAWANLDRYDKSMPLMREALAIQQRTLPPTSPDLAFTYQDLGIDLWRQKDYVGAEENLRRAYVIMATLPDDEDVRGIYTATNLGAALARSSDPAKLREARALLQKAATGAVKRGSRAVDFDEEARSDLRRNRGTFLRQVKVAFDLSK